MKNIAITRNTTELTRATGDDVMPGKQTTLRRKKVRTQSAWTPDMQRLYELTFGMSGDIEGEYKAYQDYFCFDPHNRKKASTAENKKKVI